MAGDPLLTRPSLREVLAAVERGSASGAGAGREDAWRAALLAPADDAHAPWFVRALVGTGAWVSALLFAIAAGLCGIADSSFALSVLGLAAFGGGVALRRWARAEFPVQLALALSIGGRMTVYAVVFKHGEPASAWCVALALETVGVLSYPDVVGRFVATVGGCAAAFGLSHALGPSWLSQEILTLGLAAVGTWAWLREPRLVAGRFAPFQRPVGFGLVVALLFAQLFALLRNLDGRDDDQRWHFSVVAAGLLALLLLVEREIMRETLAAGARAGGYRDAARAGEAPAAPAPPETRPLVIGGTLALGALGQLAPGLMGAVLVMALGVHRRNTLLFGLAALFLLFFGAHFYFSLSLSLLAKSGVLLGSGLLCLALRLPLARAAKEETS